ncbi:MAG: hypothetical protein CMLOHMNK_01626 [Steroidobacteraceae bacterium]|nr:hypothetical protein [Steroidobacteraceae bacterium]
MLAAGTALAGGSSAFSITSSAFGQGGTLGNEQVFNGFDCRGGNISPALAWKNAPPGTKSFALMVHDPDAPTGSGWWHWIVYDIPATSQSLPAGAGAADGRQLPTGAIQGRNDYGTVGYGGACPPKGDKPHRYFFRLFALEVAKLDVPADATAALIGFAVNANTIAVAEIQAFYGR